MSNEKQTKRQCCTTQQKESHKKPRVKSGTQEGNAFPVPLQSPIVVLLSDMTINVILNSIQIVFAMKVHNVVCTSGSVVLVWYLDLPSTYGYVVSKSHSWRGVLDTTLSDTVYSSVLHQ